MSKGALKIGEHIMAHPEGPTWCVRCGTFDCYCASVNGPTECAPKDWLPAAVELCFPKESADV